MLGVWGVIVIETNPAALTVRVADPFTGPELIAMVVTPVPSEVARPCVPAELLTVALKQLRNSNGTTVSGPEWCRP